MSSSSSVMTAQDAHNLVKKIAGAKNADELQTIIADNVMWCDGIFFAELEKVVEEFKNRGDENSARKLKEVGGYMARLRFMI